MCCTVAVSSASVEKLIARELVGGPDPVGRTETCHTPTPCTSTKPLNRHCDQGSLYSTRHCWAQTDQPAHRIFIVEKDRFDREVNFPYTSGRPMSSFAHLLHIQRPASIPDRPQVMIAMKDLCTR